MFDKMSKPLEPTDKEELRFIFQSAVAPLSIIKRVVLNHQSLWASIKQSIDRDEYLKYLRKKTKPAKHDAKLTKATFTS